MVCIGFKPLQPTASMNSERVAFLLVVGVASVATLAPRSVSAQMVSATTQLNSRAWLKNECSNVSCMRSVIQNNVALSFVPVGATADLFARAEAFVASTDLSAFIDDCSQCKDTDRPFVVPPGLAFKLALGNGLPGGNSGKSQSSGSGDDDSDDGVGASNIPVMVPANGGLGGSNSATVGGNGASPALLGAAPVEVTTNPEPATIALMATGLIGLVPVIRRRRRSR